VADTTYETLRFERDGDIGFLRLHRPDKLNSFTIAMWRELREFGERAVDDDLRVLILSGEGRAFSSGIDTSVFTSGGADQLDNDRPGTHADPTVASILQTQDAYTWLEEAPYPTIASVHGYALGAGLQIALACDVRVFARGTKVGLLEHKYGILPDLGGTQRLPRLVGPGKAKELIWTAARIEDADALERETRALAETIAAQPPLAVRGAKRAVDAAGRLPVREGLVVEAEAQAVCLRSDDMREAITAFVEQRAPKYTAS
jgi:enoyl-CoA hydratase/carnithine racemase